jgi:dihydrolipoamide dehydrogenase
MEIVVMPKLGFNMDEGTLVEWYKAEGDAVSKGEALFSVETDKTAIDVEATQDGVVRKLFIAVGDTVPVTLPIAIIAGVDENIDAAVEDALAKLAAGAPAAAGDAASQSPGAAPGTPATSTPASPVAQPAPAAPVAPKPARDYDAVIVGGGPGGYVAAIRAAQLGLKVALAEKDRVGGVCLNRGCIPTKTLLRSLEALNEVKAAKSYGVAGLDASKAKLDMKAVQKRKKAVVEELVTGVEYLLKKNGVDVLAGEAKIEDKNAVSVAGKVYSTDNIVIATGSEVKHLPDGIIKRKQILTSDDLLGLDKIPGDIAVIGGGVIGVEFAYFLAGAGAKVTIVEFLDRILPTVDGEIAALVTKDLEALGVVCHTDARVTSITEKAVEFEKNGKTEQVPAKSVLVAVGRAPRIPQELESLGVKTENGAIVTDERLRTNVEGVYAVGDVNGRLMLAHTASMEGIVAAENIAGVDRVMRYDAIPSAVYISPEVASVGLTEEDAKAAFDEVKIGRFPLLANGKAKVAGVSSGSVKVVVDAKYGEVLGVHLYCPHATDMIAEAVVAMNAEASAEEIAASVHPHPTISEAVAEAFHDALGGAIHY